METIGSRSVCSMERNVPSFSLQSPTSAHQTHTPVRGGQTNVLTAFQQTSLVAPEQSEASITSNGNRQAQ